MESYSTQDLPARQKLSYWNEISSTAFAPMEVVPAHRHEFDGALYRQSFGDLALAEVHSSAGTIEHTRRHVGRTDDHGYILLMSLSGGVGVSTERHESRLDVGDCCLLDHARPYRLTQWERSSTFCVGFSRPLLRRYLPDPGACTGQRLHADNGMPQLSQALLLALRNEWSRGALPGTVADLAPHVAAVVASACNAAAPASSSAEERRHRIRQHIEAHLQDPALTPARIAAHFGMSSRLLRLVFNRGDETLSGYILRRRLEQAAQCLSQPGWDGCSITDIAMRLGFGSSTQFGVAFKKHHGVTPRAYRASRRPAP